ncbi:MAG TPA: NADPH-dependent FMN reductase, partial [Candidatus Binatia bacterium]|nr:NADPH-dependent FMN reductase [Candidatus Binatia bacterium]
MPKPKVRTGTPSAQISREEFSKRARERFYDPSFAGVAPEIERIIELAWKNYSEYHKSPRTRRAGTGFSDPDFTLPVEWLETRDAIHQAE